MKRLMKLSMPIACFLLIGTAARAQDYRSAFEKADAKPWKMLLDYRGTANWRQLWLLDGLKATVRNTPEGMILTAGPTAGSDGDHAVLWTKQNFIGDVKIEYDFTRLDESHVNGVNILYVQATGSGAEGYGKDIAYWAEPRNIPAMKEYFNHMNTYHISYATDGSEPTPESQRYIRARRYMPETGKGLKNTELTPDYPGIELFETGVKYHITVIKSGTDLFFQVQNDGGYSRVFYFDGSGFPPIAEGRIGLRHMATRSALYSNFKVYETERELR